MNKPTTKLGRRAARLGKSDYDVLKSMVGYGAPAQGMATVSGWSAATISRVARSETFEDYLENVAQMRRRARERHEPEIAVAATPVPSIESVVVSSLERIEKLLSIIAFGEREE